MHKKLRIGGSTRGTAFLPILETIESGALHAEIVHGGDFGEEEGAGEDDDDEVGNDDGYEVICAQEIDQIPTLAQPAT